MQDTAGARPLLLRVGGLTRSELREALTAAEVQLNDRAETLLQDQVFDDPGIETVELRERTVAGLGFAAGATLPQIFAGARERGLLPCPPATGPCLRLASLDQSTAPDSTMSIGRAPAGSVTVASLPLRSGYDYPKGFYLRVVDGQAWLRGYRCSEDHLWSPDDTFAFQAAPVRR